MPKKVRVYELSKALGMTLTEVLDVCDALGIGVKTHSSSMEEAQADRVRRRAERDGLIRDEPPPEPRKSKRSGAPADADHGIVPQPADAADQPSSASGAASASVAVSSAQAASKTAQQPRAADAAAPVAAPAPADVGLSAAARADAVRADADETDRARSSAGTAATRSADAPSVLSPSADAAQRGRSTADRRTQSDQRRAAAATVPTATASASASAAAKTAPTSPASLPPPPMLPPPPRRLVTSSGQETGKPTAAPASPASAPIDQRPAARAEPVTHPGPAAPAAPPSAPPPSVPPPPGVPPPVSPSAAVPLSRDGKPIPPPPGPPRSGSGKPIPPPPGPPRAHVGARSGGPGSASPGGFRRPAAAGRRPGAPSPGTGAGAGPGAGPGSRPPGPTQRPGVGPRPMPARRGRRVRRRRRQREELQPQQLTAYTPLDAPVPQGEVVVERGSTAQEVAACLNRSAADVVRFLLQQGEIVTATQSLSDDMVELFAAELGAVVRIVEPGAEQEQELLRMLDISDPGAHEAPRPPVITVMGHVDHGKTLLLDRIRSANVTEGEAGGITQHIGAYQVERNGSRLTFIDTPGHEAFTAMRARGAQATDIVVLVVAADDGVMPQTIEAIDHARAADVEIVVAVNKIDREAADPDRVHAQLAAHGLVPESYGGDVVTVPLSAMTGEGIDELLDQVLVVAELEELAADPTGRAVGIVLESHLDRGRGAVATVLVQRGTLSVGEPMVAGAAWGRVRAITDDRGRTLSAAGPSAPVAVLGLGEVARAGDLFAVAPDERTAGKVAETREHWQRQASLAGSAGGAASGTKLEDVFRQVQAGETATLNLVLKADFHGSLEAVTDSLRKLERDDVRLTFVSRGVGGINENDIQLAAASNATIIGFNVRPDRNARQAAETEGVEVRLYEIIYQLIEDVQNAMVGMLGPEFEEVVRGEAQVRQVFRIAGVGPVAGCVVSHGTVASDAQVRFLRNGAVIWKGSIRSLRHFQDAVDEVTVGMECGIGLSDFTDLKEGDVIETFEEREIARTP